MSPGKPPSRTQDLTVSEFENLVRGGDFEAVEFFVSNGQPARLETGPDGVFFDYRCRDGVSRIQVDGDAYYSRQRVVPLEFKRL